MNNLFDIEQSFLNIFEELEENGGELTPELEDALNITQENFINKIKSYVNVIKSYKNDLDAVKCESNRLKDYKTTKNNTLERLNNRVIEAVEKFGDTNKNGVNFVDYSTGKVSIRKTKNINIDEELFNKITSALSMYFSTFSNVSEKDVLNYLVNCGLNVTEDDLKYIVYSVQREYNIIDLINNFSKVKEINKDFNSSDFTIDKGSLKEDIYNNENFETNLAEKSFTKSLIIK
jgi:hypothetical protein